MELLVTVEEHEQGWKDLEVLTRAGKRQVVRLAAPTRRLSRGLAEALKKDPDPWPIVAACRPRVIVIAPGETPDAAGGDACAPLDERWMDGLTPASADMVETVAFALHFGLEFQKKMVEIGEELAKEGQKGQKGLEGQTKSEPL